MILQAKAGLCNRLRTILSRLEPGLVVYWEPDVEIAGARWDDVFEPLEGVTFVYDRPERVDLATGDGAPGVRWIDEMRRVRPLPAIRQRVADLCAGMGRFDAMFVRRTDGVFVAEEERNFTPDDAFRAFAASTSRRLFLATDNGETQRKFRAWVGERLVVEGELGGTERHEAGDHTRHQSLAGSVVNLYVCVEAEYFVGSGGSSFSDTITWLREMRAAGWEGP